MSPYSLTAPGVATTWQGSVNTEDTKDTKVELFGFPFVSFVSFVLTSVLDSVQLGLPIRLIRRVDQRPGPATRPQDDDENRASPGTIVDADACPITARRAAPAPRALSRQHV